MIRKTALFALFCLAVSAAPVLADEISGTQDYGTGVGRKLGRGISNVAFGWLDIFKGIEDVGDEQNFIAGVTWGPIYGVGNAVRRTAAGVVEVVTFPVPAPDSHYDPLVQPEFVLQDKDQL